MGYNDIILSLNEIVKKNDLSLVNEFIDKFTKLLEETLKPQFFIDINANLIRRSYKVIISLYGEKATFEHFKTLINNNDDKGREMIEECMKKNLELEDEIGWFLNDYFTGFYGFMGATKTYDHCIYSSRLIDAIIDSGLV